MSGIQSVVMHPRSLLLLPALLALSACGSLTPTSSTSFSSASPAQAVQTATHQLDSTPLHFTVSGDMTFDTSELRHVAGFDLSPQPVTITGEGEAESAARSQVVLHSGGESVTVVSYDGAAWMSADGARFAPISSAQEVTGGINTSSGVLDQFANGVADVTDLGSSVNGGVVLDHLHIDLDPTSFGGPFTTAYADALAASDADPQGGCGCRLPPDFAEVVAGATYFKTGGVEVYVRHDNGRVTQVLTSITIATDFDRMAQEVGAACACELGLPSGSMVSSMKITETFTAGGGAVTITKPSVDPHAPAPRAPNGGVSGFMV
jgi:hypothetical protein